MELHSIIIGNQRFNVQKLLDTIKEESDRLRRLPWVRELLDKQAGRYRPWAWRYVQVNLRRVPQQIQRETTAQRAMRRMIDGLDLD